MVVEANKHQLVYVPIPKEAQQVDEGAVQTHRPKSPVAARTAGADRPLHGAHGPEAR